MKAVLIDAYDSFVYIIEQYLAELGAEPVVIRSDPGNTDRVRDLAPDVLVLGPGPGHPLDSGHVELVHEFAGQVPILGVCLGHQAIGAAYGATVSPAAHIMHGKTSTLDHDGRVLDQAQPEVWKTPISPATADIMTDLMVSVAENGTASCCIALEGGIPVAAKTGTAQLNGPGEPERSHAWIIAFAPADQPQYAVAVMLKGTTEEISAGTGGRLAGPIAKTVLDAALAGGQTTARDR